MSGLQKFHRRTMQQNNTVHTGTITISGMVREGRTLTTSNTIADADGLGNFAYQWRRGDSTGTYTNITGATTDTYTLVTADVGKFITATITYTDTLGFVETETSAPTSVVLAIPVLGSGNNTIGYYLYSGGGEYYYVAPKSTQVVKQWGSSGILRSTSSAYGGLSNTNTLAAFGAAAHPAAYYCKTLTTGGYNTWYLPSRGELSIYIYPNRQTAPFHPVNGFDAAKYWTSTESTDVNARAADMGNGSTGQQQKITNLLVRAVRKTL